MSADRSMFTCTNLSQLIVRHLNGHGYEELPARGLLSSAFTDTFAPSAFHEDVVARVHNGPEGVNRECRAGVDWVFRHIDLDKAATSPWHLSCFQMGIFFDACRRSGDDEQLRYAVVQRFVQLLRELELPIARMIVTYFGGGVIRGKSIEPDENVVDLFKACGLNDEQLVPVRGTACFTNCEREGEPAGPRCEVFVPTNGGKPIEVGTVVFERYVIGDGGELIDSQGLVFGGALGIERLVMLKANLEDLVAIADIQPVYERIRSSVDSRLFEVSHQQVRGLIDGLRSMVVIRSQVAPIDDKRGRRVRTLVRRIRRYLIELGIDDRNDAAIRPLVTEAARCIHVDGPATERVLNDLSTL